MKPAGSERASVLTNPAARSAEDRRAYTSAILDLLGSEEPMQVLASTPDALRTATAGLTPEDLARPEREGKWSITHVLQHLADSELVWGWRLRLVLAQDRPALTGFDQDAWAERLRYDLADPEQAFEQFALLRRANLRLLARASRADLDRAGIHAERGEESVAFMIRLYAGHDLAHLRQVARIRAALTG